MTLSEAIQRRDELREQGTRCQLRHETGALWLVLIHGVDY